MTESYANENISPGEDADSGILDGDLSERMAELARSLHAADGQEAILEHMVRAAMDMIPGAEEGSISLVSGRKKITSRAPSGDLPRRVDALQEKVGQGPCLDAGYEQKTVSVPDMDREDRWPKFVEGALDLGVVSMLSFQLYVDEDNFGVLNLYSRIANAFDGGWTRSQGISP